MKNFIYVFYYAKELVVLSVVLLIGYGISKIFLPALIPFFITIKLVLPFVFFLMKKLGSNGNFYFLYNLGMTNLQILLCLYCIGIADVLLIQLFIP